MNETVEPLSAPWISEYRARIEPLLTPIQLLAAEAIWNWFDSFWQDDVSVEPFRLFQNDVQPLFEPIESAGSVSQRDDAIVRLVESLRGTDLSRLAPPTRPLRR